MKVTVIGTGYVGLPTGVGLAELGNDGRLVDMQLEQLVAGLENEEELIIKDYKIIEDKTIEQSIDEIINLTYEDLLKPEYKGLISMPSPKASGTGYIFLKALVNSMGEDKAFAYFDKLSKNVSA